jgi:FAD/FMN-containing dehydrogenase
MHFAGASNIANGVTIDLVNLKQVDLSSSKTEVAVGPGNRWKDVFAKLDPLGVTVLGGRWATVGVGGLLTGGKTVSIGSAFSRVAYIPIGGLSFFSKRYGLAMDGIINHEVVLANGTIVNANATSNTDLHKALKGGSSNFGIVTRFDLKSFKQEKVWGGIMVHSPWQQQNSLKFLEEVSKRTADPGVHILQAFST